MPTHDGHLTSSPWTWESVTVKSPALSRANECPPWDWSMHRGKGNLWFLDHESEGSWDSTNDVSSPGNNMPNDKTNTEGYHAGTVKGRAKAKFKTSSEFLNPVTAGSGPNVVPCRLVLLLWVRVGILSFAKPGVTIKSPNFQSCF